VVPCTGRSSDADDGFVDAAGSGHRRAVAVDDPAALLVREATAALRKLDQVDQTLRPLGIDRFAASAEVLDELARLAELLGHAVERTSGRENDRIREQVHALSRTITEHRNTLLRRGLADAPEPLYDRSVALPARRARPLVERLMAREWSEGHRGGATPGLP
jgi:hypothetical protein